MSPTASTLPPNLLPTRLPLLAVAPANAADASFFQHVHDSGALGVLDATLDTRLDPASIPVPFAARIPSADAMPRAAAYILTADAATADLIRAVRDAHPASTVIVECLSATDIDAAVGLDADALIVKGRESGGSIGEASTLTLLLDALDRAPATLPVWVQGGIGPQTLAGALAAGAAGAVIDTAFLGARDAGLAPHVRSILAAATATDTAVTGESVGAPTRVFARGNRAVTDALREAECAGRGAFDAALAHHARAAFATTDLREGALPVGEDIALAGLLGARHGTVKGVVRATWDGALRNLGLAAVIDAPEIVARDTAAELQVVRVPADAVAAARASPAILLAAAEAAGPSAGVPCTMFLEEAVPDLAALPHIRLDTLTVDADIRGLRAQAFLRAATAPLAHRGIRIRGVASTSATGTQSVVLGRSIGTPTRVAATDATRDMLQTEREAVARNVVTDAVAEAVRATIAAASPAGAHTKAHSDSSPPAPAGLAAVLGAPAPSTAPPPPRRAASSAAFANQSSTAALGSAPQHAEPGRPRSLRANPSRTTPIGDRTEPLPDSVAIIGYAGIFPGSTTIDGYWQNILDAKDSIIEVPEGRWQKRLHHDPDPNAEDKTYSVIGGFVTDFTFNSAKYRIPPAIANQLDPVQQWVLAASSDALAHAGYAERDSFDRARCAVILGNSMGGEIQHAHNKRLYLSEAMEAVARELPADLPESERDAAITRATERLKAELPRITEDSMPGTLANVIAGRVANVLDLGGKNYVTDAACASSLAALDDAVRGLQAGEFDMVLTGGADRSMDIASYVKFCRIGALSPDGSRPFDSSANGFVMGEGAGIVVLKRLTDALRDGDTIHAVVRGVGASSDGRGKGITAPNPEGQRRAVSRALDAARILPRHVQLIEAHGTSTRVGDVVEVEVLSELYKGLPVGSIALGSVKSQIGHLKSAAGVAGLIKATLALENRVLPPSANFREPNPNINWSSIPLAVNAQARPWPDAPDGEPRRAAVSAFGFGGTNFHAILEEYVPAYHARVLEIGALEDPAGAATSATAPLAVTGPGSIAPRASAAAAPPDVPVLTIAAPGLEGLALRAKDVARALATDTGDLQSSVRRHRTATGHARLAIAASTREEFVTKLGLAAERMGDPAARAALLPVKGIHVHEGVRPGTLAFTFPGQGSQYANMLGDVVALHPVARATFEEADAVLEPLIGRRLTALVFADPATGDAGIRAAEAALRETEVTQPAMLAADIAILRVLQSHGVEPDAVAGHSLGEYAALVAAGVMPFKDALLAVSARGKEMANVQLPDMGRMASVVADSATVERILASIDGYVVAANKNAPDQTVIAGATGPVTEAIARCEKDGLTVIPLNVSAAFHTEIVAPASGPLGKLLATLDISAPRVPVIANVNAEPYPQEPRAIVDLLAKQVAAPVEWQRTLERLHADGTRVFVECGPKRALTGLVRSTLGDRAHAILTNHPKKGGEASLNDALAQLWALGFDVAFARDKPVAPRPANPVAITKPAPAAASRGTARAVQGASASTRSAVAESDRRRTGGIQASLRTHFDAITAAVDAEVVAAHAIGARVSGLGLALDDIVVSGASLGLPGGSHRVFDDANADRLMAGENRIDRLTAADAQRFVDKGITRLVKDDQDARFEAITDAAQVIKLAARRGAFDMAKEYGLDPERVDDWDVTTKLAIAAGLDALRDAGIPLVREEVLTSRNTLLPGRWKLPASMQADTGIVFASAFPGYDNLVKDVSRHLASRYAGATLDEITGVFTEILAEVKDPARRATLTRWFAKEAGRLSGAPGQDAVEGFSRKFLFRVLAFGHAQFAELIGARGPNLQVNAACASTSAAVTVAEDWIRAGRAKRVIVIGADDVTSENLLEWIGSGFLASGAATTEGAVEDAALPFDQRRNGMIVGMGAAGLVIETAASAAERATIPVARLVATRLGNSAYHGSRLDVDHIAGEVDAFVRTAADRIGTDAAALAGDLVFMSHETFTPPRGGSAGAEVAALRKAFGADATRVLVTNVKGYTGHPMGAGIEDALSVKILQHGRVPPVANLRKPDPEFSDLMLSRGGAHDRRFALRLAAGFGSQLALLLFERVAQGDVRVSDAATRAAWLAHIGGGRHGTLVVEDRTLRLLTDPNAGAMAAAAVPAPSVATHVPVQPRRPASPAATLPVLHASSSATTTANIATAASVIPVPSPSATDSGASVLATLTALVAAKTGYPEDALDPELDMEADLGIDTVKQAEIFGAIRDRYHLPREEGMRIKEYPTLAKVAGYVTSRMGGPAASGPAGNATAPPVTPAPAVAAPPIPASPPRGESASAMASAPTPATPSPSEAERTEAGTFDDDPLPVVIALVAGKTGYPEDALDPELDLEADLGIDTVKQAELFGLVRDRYNIPRVDGVKLKDYPTLAKIAGFVRDHRAPAPTAASAAAAPGPSSGIGGTVGSPPRMIAFENHRIDAPLAGVPDASAAVEIMVTAADGVEAVDEIFRAARARADALARGMALVLVAPTGAPWTASVRGLARALQREFPASRVRALETDVDGAEAEAAARAVLALDDLDASFIGGEWHVARAHVVSPDSEAAVAVAPGSRVLATGGGAGITAACAISLAQTVPDLRFTLVGRTQLPEDADTLADLDDAAIARFRDVATARLKERGERATPVAVARAIAPTLRASDVARTMRAIRAAGAADVDYVAADVADAEAIAVLPRPDVIIHGAGMEESRPLADKTEDAFLRTARPKAVAAEHLAAAFPDATLVLFGSVAGAFGNAAQADYSAANAHLNGLAQRLRAAGRNARVMAWTAWRETGMATRGSTLTVLDALGVEALGTEEGTTAFLEALKGPARDVVIVKGLGPLEPSFASGAAPASAPATGTTPVPASATGPSTAPASAPPHAPDVGGITRVDALDPATHAFLRDHAVDGTPYLPGVLGIARFTRLARDVGLPGNVHVVEASFGYPVKFLKGAVEVTAEATRVDGDAVTCRLTTTPPGPRPEARTHFTARVTADPVDALPEAPTGDMPLETVLDWNQDAIYSRFFHGATFRVLAATEAVAPRGMRVRTAVPASLPDDPALASETDALHALAIEAALQCAGLHAWAVQGISGLPHGLHGVRVRGYPVRVTARFIEAIDGRPVYEAWGTDADGSTVLHVARIELVPIGPADPATLPTDVVPVAVDSVGGHDVCRVSVAAVAEALDADPLALMPLLTNEESERLASFDVPKRRHEWAAATLAAKAALARLAPAPWHQHGTRRADDGAREPTRAGLGISVAHGAGIGVAVAWRTGPEATVVAAGLDVEHVEPRPASWAEEAFAPGERAALTTPESETRAWALKEAFLKALRLGLSVDLHRIQVDLATREPSFDVGGDAKAAYSALGAPRVRAHEHAAGNIRFALVALTRK